MRKIVAGNWKMNTLVNEGVALAEELVKMMNEVPEDVELIIAPPFTHISEVAKIVEGSNISVAAQNCSDEVSGAFTGEVSAAMLASAGVKYVILGHSERREYFCEDSAELTAKLDRAFENNLIPIYCVGETKEEREGGIYQEVIKKQLEEVVNHLYSVNFEKLVIAYEPVWAIGTGLTATSEQAEEVHAFIRATLHDKFGASANTTPILYGGSCKPGNAVEIFSKPNVNGGLIGGAALVASDFVAIAKSF